MSSTTDLKQRPQVLGLWEWVGLPELGLACLKARLAPENATSAIHGTHIDPIDDPEAPRLRFRVYPIDDDPTTFVVVEARRSTRVGRVAKAAVEISTVVTLGEESLPASLEVLTEPPAGFPVQLGRDVLEGRYAVDPQLATLAGPPKLDWQPRSRSDRRS